MNTKELNEDIQSALQKLPADARILDCGGWFIPLTMATHVVDLMPYETRGGALHLLPLPEERFSKETWFQIDFLKPELRLPFPDKYFDFSLCSHTIEDLANPFPLMRELLRVSRAGAIATPSRWHEQTTGIYDRITSLQGHPHHHWILEMSDGVLTMAGKNDSLNGLWWQTAIPLLISRRCLEEQSAPLAQYECVCVWKDKFEWRQLSPTEAKARARAFAIEAGSNRGRLAFDALWRRGRRLKHAIKTPKSPLKNSWWDDLVQLSQPYSKLPLK